MSRHEGVSCDSCLKSNFKEKRYKCLLCYDYDLCATCYEAGSCTAQHTVDHPVQCILTLNDYDLYYGGDLVSSEVPTSYTCPYCARMGFTEILLIEHISARHPQPLYEVICPICAAGRLGRPNVIREDLLGHLSLEHRSPSREIVAFFDEPYSRHSARRIPLPASRSAPSRGRRSNTHFDSSGTIAAISPTRDPGVPIADFLTHLSVVRRAQIAPSPPNAERQHARMSRQKENSSKKRTSQMSPVPQAAQNRAETLQNSSPPINGNRCQTSQQLLPKVMVKRPGENELEKSDRERNRQALFLRELLLATMKVKQTKPQQLEEFQDLFNAS